MPKFQVLKPVLPAFQSDGFTILGGRFYKNALPFYSMAPTFASQEASNFAVALSFRARVGLIGVEDFVYLPDAVSRYGGDLRRRATVLG